MLRNRINVDLVIRVFPVAVLALATTAFGADLQLATGGKSRYQIVKPDRASAVDEYAITKLAEYLTQITGAAATHICDRAARATRSRTSPCVVRDSPWPAGA